MRHTRLPWKVESGVIYTADGRPIATMIRTEEATKLGIFPVERDMNAMFIVEACNAYYENKKMNLEEAFELIIDLASNNMVDERDAENEEDLTNERRRQEEAMNMVNEHFLNEIKLTFP